MLLEELVVTHRPALLAPLFCHLQVHGGERRAADWDKHPVIYQNLRLVLGLPRSCVATRPDGWFVS